MIGTLQPGIKTGVIEHEEEGVYRTSGALSNSALSDFLLCERLFQRKHIQGTFVQGRYQPFVVGQAFHCRVLESETFSSRYAIRPAEVDGRTKDGKAWLAENTGKTILTKDEGDTLAHMCDAVMENDEARSLVEDVGQNELTIRLQMEQWKLPVQCRLDAWRPRRDMIVDLKTTADLSAWPRELMKYGYHRQACLYGHLTGLAFMREPPRFVFVVVQKSEPFCVGLFRLSDEWLARAWQEVDSGMKRIRACLDSNSFRRDEPGVRVIEMSEYGRAV